MTFFVDANIVLYAATAGPYRTPCLRVLEAVAVGEADGRTSPAVLEEVWYVERSGRAGAIEGLAAHAYTVFPPLLPVTDEAFVIALSRRAKDLGPADRVHEGTCLAHGIDVVVSADSALSKLRMVRRVDPLDMKALRRLLAGA